MGSLAQSVAWLDWLNYGQTFGLQNPIVLELGILVLTFGLTIKMVLFGIIDHCIISTIVSMAALVKCRFVQARPSLSSLL